MENFVFLNTIWEWYVKYERRISSLAFLAGFIWDNLTLTRVDLHYDNIVFITYLITATISIILHYLYEAEVLRIRCLEKAIHILPFFFQFAFGGLFSAFFIFYSRSGSLSASWPFLFLLASLLIGNEFLREKYLRLTLQLSILFFVLYSYLIFALPVLLGRMGADIFLLSGITSLIIIGFILSVLFYARPEKLRHSMRMISASIGAIYIAFNLMYFTNIIPPIPLALKEVGVYHYVQRTAQGNYLVRYEPAPWYLFFKKINPEFHWMPGSPVYVFSAVFAPTRLHTKIFHRWSYFDQQKDKWITVNRLNYPIVGGRDGGYRGYTFKQNIMPGRWQVTIENERGQILGKVKFKVVKVYSAPELKSGFK